MTYTKIIKAKFISRPNRFIAHVEIEGKTETAHVKNTGRCKELLLSGATVYLENFSENMGSRKLKYSLIAVEKETNGGKIMINVDSQAPNKVVYESLKIGDIILPKMDKLEIIKPEATYGDSRLDFYVRDIKGREGYIEVKGVTLEQSGVASFPDAPTLRGIKHLNELSNLVNMGYNAYVLFIIQMEGMHLFTPNRERHKEFADALCAASKNGVHILAYQCKVTPNILKTDKTVAIQL